MDFRPIATQKYRPIEYDWTMTGHVILHVRFIADYRIFFDSVWTCLVSVVVRMQD